VTAVDDPAASDPEAGLTVHHVWFVAPVQVSVEPAWPELPTVSVCDAGSAPPAVALNVKLVGVRVIVGVLVGI
jgi:hypothetical protein